MVETADFFQSVEHSLLYISPELSSFDAANRCGDPELYRYVEAYILKHRLPQTARALPLVLWLLTNTENKDFSRFPDPSVGVLSYRRCLSVCQMLINLDIFRSSEDEDTLLCATVWHIVPDVMRLPDLERLMTVNWGFSQQVYQIIMLCYRQDTLSETQKQAHFDGIQKNKMALLLKLAARGNLIAQFHGIPTHNVRGFIYETRCYYFPMCIYGKEHYPELMAPISVLMEKMRCLMEITEILLTRYESRENGLMQQILALQEENSAIRGMIQGLQNEYQ